jgi:hypothetical protein
MNRRTCLDTEDEVARGFQEVLGRVPPALREDGEVVPGWAPHDVAWHVAYWLGRAADVIEEAAAGPPYPAEPDDLAYYDAENDRVLAAGRAESWEGILGMFDEGRARARQTIATCSERDLEWIWERWEEELDHLREHSAELREFLSI